jgi:hypothetical protein
MPQIACTESGVYVSKPRQQLIGLVVGKADPRPAKKKVSSFSLRGGGRWWNFAVDAGPVACRLAGGGAAPAAADGSRGADMACPGCRLRVNLWNIFTRITTYGGAIYSGLCSKRVCVLPYCNGLFPTAVYFKHT